MVNSSRMDDMMNRRGQNQFGVFISGLALGGIIGAGVALLMAPRSGEEMRSMLGDRSNDLVNQLGDRVNDVRDSAQQQLDNVKKQMNNR